MAVFHDFVFAPEKLAEQGQSAAGPRPARPKALSKTPQPGDGILVRQMIDSPRMKPSLSLLFLTLLSLSPCAAGDLTLWYRQPARVPMNEALPLGNGRLGALVFGVPEKERLIVNEDSLWTGDENPSGNYDTMGAYQFLGDVFVSLPAHARPSAYRRDLDLAEALAHVSYEVAGVKYLREFFCSHPAGVLVARFTADQPRSYSGAIEVHDSHGAPTTVGANRLSAAGHLSNGLKYEWQVQLQHEGGTLQTNGTSLVFSNCTSLTLFLAAGTDYVMDYARHYRGEDPHTRLSAQLAAASQKSYETLKAEHLKDFASLFNRLALNLGTSSATQRALPTDQRKRAASEIVDPELEQLLFQYGRYLLVSCSRPGGLPANLQGLWNDSNDPPWHSDYHANINVQMNYWPAEPGNLAECHLPFLDLITSQLPAWRKAAAASPELRTPSGAPTTRGFAVRTSHNIMGGLGWKWDKTANAWYCQHFWEHYAFGQDKHYLRRLPIRS